MSRDALVVGINSYDRLKPLNAPAADAEAIAQLLTNLGDFRVRRLPEAVKDGTVTVGKKTKVSLSELEDALIQLFNPEGKNIPETALLYFSGHGLRKVKGGMQEGFLATSEVNPNLGLYGLSLRWLRELLQKSPVKQQIIWLDCCHSGELLNFEEGDPGDRGKGRDRCFIAASREFEVAYEEISGNHGVLTSALLQGLDPTQQPEGVVTNYTLADFINYSLKTATQKPTFANSGGKIILTGIQQEIPQTVTGGICPYKGLSYFDCNEEDPQYFYGRDTLTEELLGKVISGNFLAVLGASGSGKSSVVRAGLLHQLKLGQKLSGSDSWKIYIFRPGRHPLKSLAQALVDPESSEIEYALQLKKAEELIGLGAEGLKRLVAAAKSRVVLLVDQFEEVFTVCEDSAERELFFKCLLGGLTPLRTAEAQRSQREEEENERGLGLCVIMTMRADFLGKCAEREYAGLAKKIQENLITVTPMTAEELEQAITEPAKKVGLEVERELVTQMLADVEGSPGSLPLLQYTLTELWQRRTMNRLVLSTYTQLGGLKGTLQKRADEIYEAFSDEEKLAAKRIFLELTQLGEGTEDTRRQVRIADLVNAEKSSASIQQTIQKLANAKLIVTSTLTAKGSNSEQVAVVDVAHESLIRYWPKLRQWLNENREALRQKRSMEAAAQEWEEKGKSADYLLQGLRLAEAENFLGQLNQTVSLTAVAREFVEKSIERQRNNRRRTIGIVAGVMALLTGFGGFAAFNWLAAERGKANAEAIALNLSSQKLFASGIEFDALIDAIKAGKLLQKSGAEANTKMQVLPWLSQLVRDVKKHKYLLGHSDRVYSVSFSPDGQTLASGSADNTIKLWSLDGQELATLKGHSDQVISVSFSPDGQTLASGSADNTIKLWSLDGQELATFKGHSYAVTSVSFSPDGKTIASGSADNTIKLWSLDGKELATLKGHSAGVNSVSFSPDGKTLASASWDKTIKLWSLDGKELATFQGHSDMVYSVSFSPDGKTIASGSADKTIKLWSLDGQELATLKGHSDMVYSVSFSPDGKTIASGSADKTIKRWSLDGQELATLKGHSDMVNSVSFSPDGKTLASASWDKTIKLWSRDGKELATLKKHNSEVNSVSFSPDGKTIASGSWDSTIRLWSLDGQQLATLKGHSDMVKSVSFSPDGKKIASGSADNTIKLWSMDGQELATLKGHSSSVNSASFSPDGKTIASASWDNTIKLWSMDGQELATLKGHGSSVYSISFSPDGKTIASGSLDGTIKLWSMDGQELATLKGHGSSVNSVSFSPDGKTLASGSNDNTIKLWSLDGQELATLKGHSEAVNSLSFSPDGKTLASASSDNTIKLWSLDGKELGTLQEHSGEVFSVSFSPDGKTLASASRDKTIILWSFDLDNLLGRGCNWLHDYLKNPNNGMSANDERRRVCDGIGTNS